MYKQLYILPEIFLGIWICIILGYGIIFDKKEGQFSQQKKLTWLSILTLSWVLILLIQEISYIDGIIKLFDQIEIDKLNTTIKIISIIGTIIILLLSQDIYVKVNWVKTEYPLLILLSTLGMILLVQANELIYMYLSIELMSLTGYVLAGIKTEEINSVEAGIKYFILGSMSSGIILLGSSIIYGLTGETNITAISNYIMYNTEDNTAILVAGTIIIIAILFKIGAAPFHNWVPDVYEGAENIVTAYFSTVGKVAVYYILILILNKLLLPVKNDLILLIEIAVGLSILIGSIAGINQTKIKRLLAYSAISHVGFMMIGLIPGTIIGLQAGIVYLIIYMILGINIFAIILAINKTNTIYLTELVGIARINPIIGITIAITLLGMAGIPPIGGFMSKYLVLMAAIENKYYEIAILGVIGSVISCFYYVRIIKWMYFRDTEGYIYKVLGTKKIEIEVGTSIIIGATLYIIMTILIYPEPILNIILETIMNK